MKANLTARGILEISPETSVEAYALSEWARNGIDTGKVIVSFDCSKPELNPSPLGMFGER